MNERLNLEISREQLYQLYEIEKLTSEQIAQKIGCSKPSVLRFLKKFNIPLRKSASEKQFLFEKEKLIELYINQKKTTREIGKILGCSAFPIEKALKEFNIKRRSRQDYHVGINHFINPETSKHCNYNSIPVYCSACGDFIENRSQSRVKKDKHSYCKDKKKNCRAKSSYLFDPAYNSKIINCDGCGEPLEPRSPSEINPTNFHNQECYGKWVSLNKIGENSPRWKGGWEEYYGESWEHSRKMALLKDSGRCRFCQKGKRELGVNPSVHHKFAFRLFGVKNHKKANNWKLNLFCLCPKHHALVENDDLFFSNEFCKSLKIIENTPETKEYFPTHGICFHPLFKNY